MRIESSQLNYLATHRSINTTVAIDQTVPRQAVQADTVQLSPAAVTADDGVRDDLQDMDAKQRLAILTLEHLLGRKLQWYRASPGSKAVASGTSAPAPAIHRRTEIHSEAERTTFQASGAVTTADGRRIEFAAAFDLQRAFQSATTTEASPKSTDPLVIHFGGTPVRLSGAKVSFDLNSDGKAESISFVENGSGFLALDANHDGQVNDGSELFGPQSGNGFADLAAYDADHNGWIDEADPVFSELRIWTQEGLSTLAAKGVGAISVASAETPFDLKDGAGALQGNLRRSGIFLSENGTAGTVQQVDLVQG